MPNDTARGLAEEIAWRTCCPDQKACPAPTRSMCSRWSYVAPAAEFLTALCAARPDVAALLAGEAVAVPRKLLREAHACMRECGWHLAWTDPTPVTDGVLETACVEIEASIGKLFASPYAKEPKA